MEYTLDELQFLSETGIDLHLWERDEALDEAAIKAREQIKKGEAYQKFLEAKKAYRTEKDLDKKAELIQACIDLIDEVICEAEEMPADSIPEWIISFVIINLKAIPAKLFWSIFGYNYTKIPLSLHTTQARFLDELRGMRLKLQAELHKVEKEAAKSKKKAPVDEAVSERIPLDEGVIDVVKTLASKVTHVFKPGGKVEQKGEAPEAKVQAMAKFADLEPKKVKGDDGEEEVPDKLAKKAADLTVSLNPMSESAVDYKKAMDFFTDKQSLFDELTYIICSFYKSYRRPKRMYFFGTMNPDTACFVGVTDNGIMVENKPYAGPMIWMCMKAANDKSLISDDELYGYQLYVEESKDGGLSFGLSYKYDKMSKADALKYVTSMVTAADEDDKKKK